MRYYIDRVWFDRNNDSWISYECPIENYYDNYEEVLSECELLNDTKFLYDNEKYIVVEVEEWKEIKHN